MVILQGRGGGQKLQISPKKTMHTACNTRHLKSNDVKCHESRDIESGLVTTVTRAFSKRLTPVSTILKLDMEAEVHVCFGCQKGSWFLHPELAERRTALKKKPNQPPEVHVSGNEWVCLEIFRYHNIHACSFTSPIHIALICWLTQVNPQMSFSHWLVD